MSANHSTKNQPSCQEKLSSCGLRSQSCDDNTAAGRLTLLGKPGARVYPLRQVRFQGTSGRLAGQSSSTPPPKGKPNRCCPGGSGGTASPQIHAQDAQAGEDYKDTIGKSYQPVQVLVSQGGVLTSIECGGWSKTASCASGHRFAKQLYCWREWCPRCGRKGSAVHKQRFARWLPKARQIASVGYWVVELLLADRSKFRDAKLLRKVRRSVVRWLKRNGVRRALVRWHWFNDPPEDGSPPGWNPHLNILFDGAYVPKDRFEAWVKFHKEAFARAFGVSDIIAHYEYRDTVAKKVHTLEYVTRATFLDARWDPELVKILEKFNNCVSFGSWKDAPVWEMEEPEEQKEADDLVALNSGMCPKCGKPLVWDKAPIPTMTAVYGGFRPFVPGWLCKERGP